MDKHAQVFLEEGPPRADQELLCTIVITTELKIWCLKQEMRTKELQP